MPSITITLTDTPEGGVAVHTDFKPAIGAPCSVAQAAALDIIRRTTREYGLELPRTANFIQTTGDKDALRKSGDRRFWVLEGDQ
jgi:hypothetical protein